LLRGRFGDNDDDEPTTRVGGDDDDEDDDDDDDDGSPSSSSANIEDVWQLLLILHDIFSIESESPFPSKSSL